MNRIVCCLLAGLLIMGCGVQKNASRGKNPQRIFLAGASTCSNYDESQRPQYGWGEKLQECLPGTVVFNHAKPGRSTKSFIAEGRWDALLSELESGDVVVITFGHNDEKIKDPKRYAAPDGEYYENLCRFARDVKGKGAVPVIMSPVSRRHFKQDGSLSRTHGKYPAASKKAAHDSGAFFIDLERLTYDWLVKLGPEESKKCFLWTSDKKDNTHFQERGAEEVARIVAGEIKSLKIL